MGPPMADSMSGARRGCRATLPGRLRDAIGAVLRISLALVCIPSSASSRRLNVPEEYPTIQAAIDGGVDGDSVSLAAGVYTGPGNYEIQWITKQLVILSRSGAGAAVLDGENVRNRYGFYCGGGLGRAAIIDGLDFRRFYGWVRGGGILCRSSLTIRNCRFENNGHLENVGAGKGIAIVEGDPRVEDCVFRDNRAWDAGCAIFMVQLTRAEFVRCRFLGNFPMGPGGAVRAIEPARLLIEDCEFRGNAATDGGAICWTDPHDATIRNSLFSGNVADVGGAVLSSWGRGVVIENCTFASNKARKGGAVYLSSDPGFSARFDRCLFTDNCASGVAGDLLVVLFGRAELSCCAFRPDEVRVQDSGQIEFSGPQVTTEVRLCQAPPCPTGPDCGELGGDFRLRSDSPCLAQFSPCGQRIGAFDPGCSAPEPVGACCVDTLCSLQTRPQCSQLGGVYQGDGVSCYPDTCAPTAVERTT